MKNYELEKTMDIYDNDEGVSIRIEQWCDLSDDIINIRTTHDKKSEEFFGKIELLLCHEQIDLLIKALQEVKEHQIKNNEKTLSN